MILITNMVKFILINISGEVSEKELILTSKEKSNEFLNILNSRSNALKKGNRHISKAEGRFNEITNYQKDSHFIRVISCIKGKAPQKNTHINKFISNKKSYGDIIIAKQMVIIMY